MKRIAAVLLAIVTLSGCTMKNKELEQGLQLRTKLLAAQGCQFETVITADYGDKLQTFSLSCEADAQGTIRFSVLKPESIAGITGEIDGEDGKLTFGDTALFFPLLADEQVTPVCAPWLLIKTLRSGYLTSAGKDGNLTRLTINDSYADDALHLDIWLEEGSAPIRAEILFRERKILSLDVRNFRIE